MAGAAGRAVHVALDVAGLGFGLRVPGAVLATGRVLHRRWRVALPRECGHGERHCRRGGTVEQQHQRQHEREQRRHAQAREPVQAENGAGREMLHGVTMVRAASMRANTTIDLATSSIRAGPRAAALLSGIA